MTAEVLGGSDFRQTREFGERLSCICCSSSADSSLINVPKGILGVACATVFHRRDFV